MLPSLSHFILVHFAQKYVQKICCVFHIGFKECAGQWLWTHVVMQVEVRRTTIPMTKSRRGLAMGDQIILCSAYEFCFCCIGQGTISKAKLIFSLAAFNVSKLLFELQNQCFLFTQCFTTPVFISLLEDHWCFAQL